jgi:phosphomannomutase/phosphoglucomutase
VRGHFREAGYEVIDVDGARIVFPDGWGLVRASNTQPAIVARFEAKTPEALARIRALVGGELRERGCPFQPLGSTGIALEPTS